VDLGHLAEIMTCTTVKALARVIRLREPSQRLSPLFKLCLACLFCLIEVLAQHLLP
jgi:hypothetical protein